MNMVDAYNTIGIEITDDIKEIRKFYKKKYANLQRKIAKDRRQGKDISKNEKKLQELNQAYNYFNVRASSLKEIAEQAKSAVDFNENLAFLPEDLKAELLNSQLENKDYVSQNFIKNLRKSINVDFKDMEPPIEVEEVTLGVYLRGGHIMINNTMFEIPQGFEGVMSRLVDNDKLQFIHINVKNSVTFKLDKGDLILLQIPKKHVFEDGALKFTFSGVDFELSKSNGKYNKSTDTYVFKTNMYKYGTKSSIKVIVDDRLNRFEDLKAVWGEM